MDSKLESLLLAGIQAPSADNDHVFRFECLGDTILLWASRGEPAALEGHERALALLSLGAVVENIELRATSLGLRCAVELLPMDRPCWLRLRIAEEDPVPSGIHADDGLLANAIFARHTNRAFYRRQALQLGVREALSDSLNDPVTLHWLRGASRSAGFRLIYRAECARFASRFLHRELFSSIRFDKGWSQTADQRLPPAALSIELPMRPFFRALRHWPLMRLLNRLGAHRLIGIRAALVPAWLSAEVAVLTVPADLGQDEAWLAAGRGFERLWLKATALGLALQPLAASAVLQWLSPKLAPDAGTLAEDLRRGWAALWPQQRVAMVFRLGIPRVTPPRATRLPLSDYLQPKS